VVPQSPFIPTEPQPNDFTLAVNFTGGALNTPSALAADATGNIWVTNSGGNTVTELSHSGAVLSGSGFTATLNQPSAIAFDLNGVAWITNKGNNTISLMNDGVPQGLPLNGGGLNLPSSIAFDFFGNAWIANPGNASVSEFTSLGTAVSTTGYTGSGITMPIGIGVSSH
jgi:streptogramin lyase